MEYVVVVINCSNIVWFKQLLPGMKIEIKNLVVIFCDNTSTINIPKIKHIAIKYHFKENWYKIKR